MLQVNRLQVEVGGRVLVEDATFTIRAGDKVGLVGRNGAGKTTLLKTLAGERPAHGGSIVQKGELGYLPQEPRIRGADGDTTALTYILSGRGFDEALVRLEKLRVQLEETPDERNVERFTKAEDAFRFAGGYAAEAEVRRLAAGLGLGADRVDMPVRVLSGGERRRVELSRILFAGADLLFLDEPTNHIDADARSWLLAYMRSYRGALLVISHDLELLDESITRVIHLDEGVVHEYKGTYSQYKTARKADEIRLAALAQRQEAEIHRLSTLADSMRHQTAKRAKQAKSLDTRISKLEARKVTGPQKERAASFRFPPPPHAGRVVLEVEELAKSYGALDVFLDVAFAVERGERLLVLGLNGAGKTSLLRVIAGESEPDLGTVKLGHNVSLGYYAQEHEGITPGETVMAHMQAMSTQALSNDLRSLLGMFGLPGDKAFQDAGTLSGGEKTKLALAQLVVGKHNLLLLDEPTNNLDPPSRDAIATALAGWPGAMVVVSHDVEFVEALRPNRMLLMPDGTLDYWSDDLLELVELA